MTKEKWLEHAEMVTGLTSPSHGGNREAWRTALAEHLKNPCTECKARQRTRKANKNSRIARAVYRDLGMVRVKGNLGGIYHE